ncbi:hypothetical protein Ahy_A10g048363 [Arachis hypogaea]|uniref:Uncharacterized protein n=1 Tax=Arachis hypogaea TaxID=3818 RepID=A0A445B4Z4_ARAHY|nr:hypothetical protein Ahy_A10g048363 [Arachis hypogaea]
MIWLRNRISHIQAGKDSDTLRKYARCYLMMLIGGFLFTYKSDILVLLRWLPLLPVVLRVCTTSTHVLLTLNRCWVLAGLWQQSQDRHDGNIQTLRRRINGLTFDQSEDAARAVATQASRSGEH